MEDLKSQISFLSERINLLTVNQLDFVKQITEVKEGIKDLEAKLDMIAHSIQK